MLETLKKTTQFKRIYTVGVKTVTKSYVCFACTSEERDEKPGAIKYGIVASKKVGNAVKRNRAKRRLREAFKVIASQCAILNVDYVLVARGAALDYSFDKLTEDLKKSVCILNRMLIKGES